MYQIEFTIILASSFFLILCGLTAYIISLKKKADKYEKLFNAMPVYCNIMDKNLNIAGCSKASAELFGFNDKREYIKNYTKKCWPEYQPDGQLSEIKAGIFINKALDEGCCKLEWTHKHLNGDLIPSEITLIRLEHCRKGGYAACFTRDLREQIAHAAEIEKTQKELRYAQETAETANRTKSSFLATMNHEIRTPMNSIIGFTELAQHNCSPEKIKEYLANISESAECLLKIINDILDISHTEPGKTTPDKTPFDLANDNNDLNYRNIHQGILEKPNFSGVVLVCEDNSMNQQVIRDHLARVGLTTEIAHNGRQGIDLINKHIQKGDKPFDIILMDIYMPEMNGLEAASEIISMGIKTPIVALTANTMSNDLELYKENGIIDCLGKPFNSQELWKCLIKYLPVLSYSEEDKTDASAGRQEDDKYFQRQMRINFARNNQTTYADLVKAMQDNNIKLAHRLAHTLKSSAGQIANNKLQAVAAALEGMLEEEINPINKDELKILEHELEAALNSIAPLLVEMDANKKPKIHDKQEIRKILEKLEPMLINKNPECEEMLDDILSIPGAAELARLTDKFNFKQAIAELLRLKEKWG